MSKIRAGFQSMLDAQNALKALKNSGFKNAHLDAVDRFFEEYSEEINFPGSNKAPSLTSLVMKSDGGIFNVGAAPLTAASPMVSGMGSYHEITDNISTHLLVNTEDGRDEEVKKLIKEAGGMLR